jgi:hypothetical protein
MPASRGTGTKRKIKSKRYNFWDGSVAASASSSAVVDDRVRCDGTGGSVDPMEVVGMSASCFSGIHVSHGLLQGWIYLTELPKGSTHQGLEYGDEAFGSLSLASASRLDRRRFRHAQSVSSHCFRH